MALDPPVYVASCKQSKQNVLEVKYPSHTPVPLPIGYKSHQNQSFASPNLHSLGSLMAWRGDKSTSFGSRATKVLTSALKAETTSKPRSLEALSSRPLPVLLAANRTPSPCPSSVRNRCGSNSLHFKFTSIGLRVCKIPHQIPKKKSSPF